MNANKCVIAAILLLRRSLRLLNQRIALLEGAEKKYCEGMRPRLLGMMYDTRVAATCRLQ
jgi:hypothetical protein